MATTKYDETKILELSPLEHIRLRTGMYIGRTGDGSDYNDGIYILFKEVLDNAIDEFISGYGKKVDVTLVDNTIRVRDYGRGIPLGKVIDCVSKINTGGKFNDDVFQFSVGMNGVGTKAVNALSNYFRVKSVRDGEYFEAIFEKGVLKKKSSGKVAERNGTEMEFIPDETIFKKYAFRKEFLERRIRLSSYLNSGLNVVFNGESYRSENGLIDLLNDEVKFDKIYQPLYFRDKTLEFVFTHTNRFSEDYFSFVNGQYTMDGGTHLSAFKEGMLKAINEYSPKTKYDGDDVREGLVGAVAIRMKDPIFESQTKNKLGNPEIRAALVNKVRQAVLDLLNKNKEIAKLLLDKVEDTRKTRKDINSIRKVARERAKATTYNIPQLKDCKLHYDKAKNKGEDTMILICEGISASGTLESSRNAQNQAVFSLRGKPLNTYGLKRDIVYKNEELYNLMRALNVGDSVDNLRYNKIVFATDADVDGLHIRNLLIMFFMRFFDKLVKDKHVYVLETPLFRVRNPKIKGQNYYCYSEDERDEAMKKCGSMAEVTRFKGLGEISKDEFKEFIGEKIRLIPVDISLDMHVQEVLEFYMGGNTVERKQYILDNLVIDAENL